MSNKFHVKIGEIEFSLEGDGDYIERERTVFFESVLLQAVDAMTRSRTVQLHQVQEMPQQPALQIPEKNSLIEGELSINEFLNQKRFGTQIDTALGLIYYWEKYCNESEFTSEILKSYFQNAKITVPQNPSDTILKLTQKGYIQSTDKPKNYTITRSGITFIEQYQPKEKKDTKTSTAKRVRSKTPSAYVSLTREDLKLDKYPSIQSLKHFKDKMMLALYIVMTEEKGKAFTTIDVMHIMTDILGEKATKDQVNGVFGRFPRWFNETSDADNKKIVKRSLLNEGINYAKELINSPKSD